MVHILSEVLHKIHAALKQDGLLYVSQPGPQKTRLTVHRHGATTYDVDLDESTFRGFLDLSRQALFHAVDEGLYAIEDEATWQSSIEHETVAKWVEDRINGSDDDDEIQAVASQIEALFGDRFDVLRQQRQDWYLLLKRCSGDPVRCGNQ